MFCLPHFWAKIHGVSWIYLDVANDEQTNNLERGNNELSLHELNKAVGKIENLIYLAYKIQLIFVSKRKS